MFLPDSINQKNHCKYHEDINIHKQNHVLSPQNIPSLLQEMKFLTDCRATICTGVNASMTKGTMINAVSNDDISLGIVKQSCTENIIAQKKMQNL